MAEFILATRGSELARAQTRMVREGILRAWPELLVREEIVRSTGDLHPEDNLTTLGGSGIFTKELENVLLEGRAHAAVHSLKDLPVELPPGLVLGAVLARGNPDDVLVSARPGGVDTIAASARIGTGSPRRAGMMKALREDVRVEPIRGNVPTRVRRVAEGEFDAVILAAAGLERLGWPVDGAFGLDGKTVYATTLPSFLPAPGQGAIAVEVRHGDNETRRIVSVLNDAGTSAAVRAERSVLRALGGGCHLALGARAVVDDGMLRLEAVLFNRPGKPSKMAQSSSTLDQAEELGRAVAALLQVNE